MCACFFLVFDTKKIGVGSWGVRIVAGEKLSKYFTQPDG